jgi:hypothetical protein
MDLLGVDTALGEALGGAIIWVVLCMPTITAPYFRLVDVEAVTG